MHALAALLLAVYACHQATLLVLYLFRKQIISRSHQRSHEAHPPAVASQSTLPLQPVTMPGRAPSITVQIPLYNERSVTERIINAMIAQDYPRDQLHIQILDDSTDETTAVAETAVRTACALGLSIELVHRNHRIGYKAGALAEGLLKTNSEFIAVFDADFVPPPHFLSSLMLQHRVFDDPKIGFVQARWGYLNRDQNATTRAQAMMLDMHFMVEQPARNSSGLLMSFNGSGGIWRRTCIEQSGGWQYDTLTEDLDLCYRAQLAGWRGVYLVDEIAPGELPPTVLAFKRQQARWSRGTLQCVRKLMPQVLRAPLSLPQKAAAWMHLSGYLIHPLMLLMAITTPLLLIRSLFGDVTARLPIWLNVFSAVSLAPIIAMAMGVRAQGRSMGQFAQDLPPTLLLGIGVAFSNTVAMAAGLIFRGSGEFMRTPKSAVVLTSSSRKPARRIRMGHTLRPGWTMWIELALAAYGFAAMLLLMNLGYWWSTIPTLLYACGFGVVGISQLLARWID